MPCVARLPFLLVVAIGGSTAAQSPPWAMAVEVELQQQQQPVVPAPSTQSPVEVR